MTKYSRFAEMPDSAFGRRNEGLTHLGHTNIIAGVSNHGKLQLKPNSGRCLDGGCTAVWNVEVKEMACTPAVRIASTSGASHITPKSNECAGN